MSSIRKIAIIGNAGSGKSTLAWKLHTLLQLPVYHLDKYFWGPNWAPPEPATYKAVHDTLCDQPAWIIDGMNLRLLEYRIIKADIIIFLDAPRSVCLWRIFKRTFHHYGKETPWSALGCQEGFNWRFIKFLKWMWNFKKSYPPKIRTLLKTYAHEKEIYHIASGQDLEKLIANLRAFLKTQKEVDFLTIGR